MGERLTEYESFFKRIRNVKILNPNIHLIMDERIRAASRRIAGYWGSDPVHIRGSRFLDFFGFSISYSLQLMGKIILRLK
jgi:hypothetical protein